ncbi:MAG: T9SS type A sorting domain-containing protein [Chitinophagaceae bacterium]
MKKFVPSLILLFLSVSASAQLINRFTWESNPVTKAVFGPNAISVSSYASAATGGTNDSKGVNPGDGRYDINLVLDGTVFNVPAIDITLDFKREEAQASFYYRGSFFDFGMNGGKLGVNFMVTAGSSFVAVNSGNIYSVPDDHSYHHYRFNYDDNTGAARVWIDTTLVYTYQGTAGAPLYWTGAGNVTVGKDMDATGRNIAILDNLVIQKYANALLPLKLLSFTANAQNKYAVINWNTTQEINIHSFLLERSSNGISFSSLKSIAASSAYTATNHYKFTDSLLVSPVAYYRLKMINSDGSFTYSNTKSVNVASTNASSVTVFPNPTADYVNIKMNNTVAGKYIYTISSVTGQVITSAAVQVSAGAQQIQADLTRMALKGVVLIKLSNVQTNATETFTIVKK